MNIKHVISCLQELKNPYNCKFRDSEILVKISIICYFENLVSIILILFQAYLKDYIEAALTIFKISRDITEQSE